MKEEQLVGALKSKDRGALEYLYDNYSGALYGVVFRILNNQEIAEEALQDAFLKIWDKVDSYDSTKGRLFTWMLNIARNLAIDKTRSKEISKEKKTAPLENLVNSIDSKAYVEMRTDGIGLKETLKKLTEDQQFVIEYLYFRGYSQSEVSEEFGIPLGTVKTRLRLAMIELRNTLGVT